MSNRSRFSAFTLAIAIVLTGCVTHPRTGTEMSKPFTPDFVARPVVRLNDNGAWCWYQDERAILVDGTVLLGSIANPAGVDGVARNGNVELTAWDLATSAVTRTVLHEHLEHDDHDAPALYLRQDGRLVAVYGKHSTDHFMRWRVADASGDFAHFGPEQTLDAGAGYTYQNVYRLSAETGRVYNFHRGFGFNPNYMVSDDDGLTWRYGGRLIKWPRPTTQDSKFTGLDGGRPYARYASNNVDAVHVLVTEDHPRAYDNSIWHGIIRGAQIFKSDGKTVVAPLGTDRNVGIKPTDLTCVYKGDADHVAWTTDIRLDASGLPYVTFTVQMNDAANRTNAKAGGADIRHWYARFDGTAWHAHEIAFGGSALYSPEVDYSGLTSLDPNDPDTVYLSSNSDPTTGSPLVSRADGQRHREIFRGHTADRVATWAWTPITADSTRDNLRPIVVPGDPTTRAVIWFRGSYHTFTDYATEVVGIVDPR